MRSAEQDAEASNSTAPGAEAWRCQGFTKKDARCQALMKQTQLLPTLDNAPTLGQPERDP